MNQPRTMVILGLAMIAMGLVTTVRTDGPWTAPLLFAALGAVTALGALRTRRLEHPVGLPRMVAALRARPSVAVCGLVLVTIGLWTCSRDVESGLLLAALGVCSLGWAARLRVVRDDANTTASGEEARTIS